MLREYLERLEIRWSIGLKQEKNNTNGLSLQWIELDISKLFALAKP